MKQPKRGPISYANSRCVGESPFGMARMLVYDVVGVEIRQRPDTSSLDSVGQKQGDSRQKQGDRKNGLRVPRNTQKRSKQVPESQPRQSGRPKVERQEQAPSEAQTAAQTGDPKGHTSSPSEASGTPQVAKATKAGEARQAGEAAQDSGAKPSPTLEEGQEGSKPRRSSPAFHSPSADEIKEIENALDEVGLSQSQWKTGFLLLLMLYARSFDAGVLAKISGYTREFVRSRMKRLRDQKILDGKILHVEWFSDNPATSNTAFLLDVMVADGLVDRDVSTAGVPVYQRTLEELQKLVQAKANPQ